MATVATWFTWLCAVIGVVALFTAAFWLLGRLLIKAWEISGAWHRLLLCVGVQMHGRDYREQLFWRAIEEHINGKPFAAKVVADYAKRCAPFNEDTDI